MVVITSPKASLAAGINCELMLESGRCIYYVAPPDVNLTKEIYSESDAIDAEPTRAVRKNSSYTTNDPTDDWEGVNALCSALDKTLELESAEILDGKNVLEIGFCTGLPSVFALANGASNVTLHCADKEMLDYYVIPTLARNKVKHSQRKLISGGLDNLKKSIKEKQFDMVLAPEYINTERADFEELHDFIDYALAPDGICFLTSRMYYFNCDGNLPEFLDLIKSKGKFEPYIRWTSSKSDVVQRKVVQLTRSMR